ncbi:translation initiation factor [Prochlorococcus marinus]|uniref:translation initiation factor n=1 Tax=Prochlorococcus marinus TaxID=1219 RepID=UPI0022B43F55|nr:translation initiation factor [Prochlorococcus marinus]
MPKTNWREFENVAAKVNSDIPENPETKADMSVRVQKTRVGKGGKTVTLINGLNLNESNLRKLLKKFKTKCGTGGTVKEGSIELQGDQVVMVLELLLKEGYLPKRSGG